MFAVFELALLVAELEPELFAVVVVAAVVVVVVVEEGNIEEFRNRCFGDGDCFSPPWRTC